MRSGQTALLVLLLLAIGAFFMLDLGQYLQLATLKAEQARLDAWISDHPILSHGLYFALYVAVTALSLPGAAVMTLAGGALFGLGWGLLLVSFASSLGATLAFLTARYLLRDRLRQRYAATLARVDAGMAKDGALYLASLRLVPLFPFFVINLVMGLTGLRTRTFYGVSQLAMLPGTFVYVNAGTQLAAVQQLADVVSPGLLGAFALLGVFPLLAKVVLGRVQRQRLYRKFTRPRHFDYNLLVIGAGAGGLVSAYIAAAVRAKVGLIERHQMGGDCLNTGCVPSKALIRSAQVAQTVRDAARFGIHSAPVEVDFAAVMARVQAVIQAVEPHDSVARYTGLGVTCLSGDARLISPWQVALRDAQGERVLSARALVIATGGRPYLPPLEGLDAMAPLTSDTVWSLRERPARLLVLGGGPIGCELSQAFARLGCRVTQVERGDRLLAREDPDISAVILARFQAEGIDVRLGHEAMRFASEAGERVLYARHHAGLERIAFDQVLVAVGRAGNTEGLGLDALGITPRPNGTLPTGDDLSVIYPNIFACGDVAGPYQFTHTAAHQAWYAAVNGLFGQWKRFRADYRVVPWVTFTAPEVARVGLNETDARAQGIPFELTTYGLDDLDRAIAEGRAHGVLKVLTVPGKDRILGVSIVGPQAGELLAEFVLAMRHGLGLNKILSTIHAYPTWNEAVKYAAGRWKQAHAPQGVLRLLARYHAYRRGKAPAGDPS